MLLCALTLGLLTHVVVQPLATDDLWWHLALGQAFLRHGPWLAADPLLYTAQGPPSTAAWLSDVGLAFVLEIGGFGALRVLHCVGVAAILVLVGVLLRREGAPARVLGPALVAFAILDGDRLVQLRPHLATQLAALVLYASALRPAEGPSPARSAVSALGLALWANAHAGFLLGPILISTALLATGAAPLLARRPARPLERQRARRLLGLLLAGSLATLANPAGVGQHLAYFQAGVESPPLAISEWSPFDPWGPGADHGASGPAAWLLVLSLGAATLWISVRSWWRGPPPARGEAGHGIDPVLLALAWAGLAATTVAVRFQWLGVFALLLLARWRALGPAPAPRDVRAALGAVLIAGALTVGFLRFGPLHPWRLGWRGVPLDHHYAAHKYGHAIWLMRDAGLRGRLYAPYPAGGYAGFWLAPDIQTHINGSMNVAPEALKIHMAIRDRRGLVGRGPFSALLQDLDADLFLGWGLPEVGSASTGGTTTGHLERHPDWVLLFRNADSALYLRRHSPENLARIAAFYAKERVPFDLERGFDPGRVIREQSDWALRHGLVPRHFEALQRGAELDPDAKAQPLPALTQLAVVHAVLGLYDEAIALEQRIQALQPAAAGPRRRRVWSLLRAGRGDEARRVATGLERFDDPHDLTRATRELALRLPRLAPEEARAQIHTLPLLTPEQAATLRGMLEAPPADRLAPPTRSRALRPDRVSSRNE